MAVVSAMRSASDAHLGCRPPCTGRSRCTRRSAGSGAPSSTWAIVAGQALLDLDVSSPAPRTSSDAPFRASRHEGRCVRSGRADLDADDVGATQPAGPRQGRGAPPAARRRSLSAAICPERNGLDRRSAGRARALPPAKTPGTLVIRVFGSARMKPWVVSPPRCRQGPPGRCPDRWRGSHELPRGSAAGGVDLGSNPRSRGPARTTGTWSRRPPRSGGPAGVQAAAFGDGVSISGGSPAFAAVSNETMSTWVAPRPTRSGQRRSRRCRRR